MLGVLVTALGVLLDQLVKMWAVHVLKPMGTLPIWPDVFHLTYVENRGAAFSMLENHRWVFIVVSLAVMAALIWLLFTRRIKHPLLKWSCWCIIAGGIGNLIDRVACGFVVDLFDFRLIHFAVFNVADIFITVGTILLCIFVVFFEKFHPEAKTAAKVKKEEENSEEESTDR